ncbi:hypothetical protein [Tolypothrix sp. VBCCA 56010]
MGNGENSNSPLPTPYSLKGNWGIIKNTDTYLVERFNYDSK